jgi:CRISPR/Cas system Type II protein with McrA/HNH and RuvC-like nuclease domain
MPTNRIIGIGCLNLRQMTEITHTHCCYCRRKFCETIAQLRCTIDHFFPSSRLGKDIALNKLQCCQECNRWKADKLPQDWLKEVERYFSKKKSKGWYDTRDYAQIIGSLKHWIATMKHEEISAFRF